MKATDAQGRNVYTLLEQLAELRERLPVGLPPDVAFKIYLKELDDCLTQLCEEYLAALLPQVEEIRKAIGADSSALHDMAGLIQRSADQLHSTSDQHCLRIGLAAASLENGRTDYRDVFLALAELYVAAEEVGIDPKPHFKAIAELSSDEPLPYGLDSIRKRLSEFHTYAVLRERKGEISEEEKRATEEQVQKWFDDRLKQIEQQQIQPPAPWWKRLFGRQ